jgi:hypothetical protein
MTSLLRFALATVAISSMALSAPKEVPKDVTRVPIVLAGGHETDPQDGGRPVVLIAAALGVTPDVFREAFSHVRPGKAGKEPDAALARQNKAALMSALGIYGITGERLDTVTNYYRYVPGRNDIWPNRPAVANALVRKGAIVGYEVVSGGVGYSSLPTVSVPNLPGAPAKVELAFGKNLETNGAISAITIPQEKKK